MLQVADQFARPSAVWCSEHSDAVLPCRDSSVHNTYFTTVSSHGFQDSAPDDWPAGSWTNLFTPCRWTAGSL